MNSNIDALSHDDPPCGWVRERLIFLTNIHELILPGGACEAAPEPLEIDSTDIAASTLTSEDMIDDVDITFCVGIGES